MCGILFTNKHIINLQKNIKYLKNRGPDYTNKFTIHNYNFIHVLLSMTGKDYTIQPFIYENNNIVILFNGEIYNYKDFGNFNSDGECIINSYKKYGDDFIKKFDGEFAIVLVDFNKDLLYYSTDIFSIKPLWISINNTDIGIATYESCLKSLNFTNIQQINPNNTVKMKLSTFEILNKYEVYNFDLKQYKNSYDDWNKAFENAILKRTRNIKHNIFIGLSSGYDSGLIACVLNKLNIPYTAYSIIGSENEEIIKKRFSINKDKNKYIYIKMEKDIFIKQREFLQNNCEKYYLKIDNDEEKNYNIYKKKLDELLKEYSEINNLKDEKKTFLNDKKKPLTLSQYNKYLLNKKIPFVKKKINNYKKNFEKSLNKKLTEDNGAIGLSYICKLARQKNNIIYLTGSGADEIISDYGWNGIKHYRHSTIGGKFPKNLEEIFPWRNFFMNTQRAYLMKEEYTSGTHGIEGRYPFLDKYVVQEFLWLNNKLKNKYYKAPIYNYLKKHNYPLDINKKMGFNCGFSTAQEDSIVEQIATRVDIGITTDESLIVK